MTVIEFFACAPIENMVSCFLLNPNKVIFIGGGRRAKRRISAYSNLAKRMGINAVFEHRSVPTSSVNAIVECLESIVNTEQECCFDLTGGDDLALVAMGIVYQKYKGIRPLQMHRYNFNSKRMTDCDGDGYVALSMPVDGLTVDENIALHGGTVSSGLRFDASFKAGDAELLWGICKNAPVEWNKNVAKLTELLSVAGEITDGISVKIDEVCAAKRFPDYEKRRIGIVRFLSKLENKGLVQYLNSEKHKLSFEYKNKYVRNALSKSGNVLEHKVLSVSASLKNKGGAPMFSDAVCGVVIDWDGLLAGPNVAFGGTVNEIDVVLMKGLTPIFVSCKNGGVDESELYKLNTVAARFGNKYAKKLLVASGLNKKGQGLEYFRSRAKEMGILLVEKAHKLDDKEFKNVFMKL